MSLSQQSQDFLSAVFGRDWPEAAIIVVITADGKVRHMRAGLAKNLPDDANLYWCIAAFPYGSDPTRKLERAINVRAFVIDDVGTKVEADNIWALLGEPSRIVVTSEDNEQWVYKLDTPVNPKHFNNMRRFIGAMTGATDGMDAVHIFRLPQGINTKLGRNNWKVCGRVVPGREKDPPTWSRDFCPWKKGLLERFRGDTSVYEADKLQIAENVSKLRDIRPWVKLIPNGFNNREEWIRVCHQIAALSADEATGREAWEDYCGRWEGGINSLAEVERVWKSVWGRVSRTAGTAIKAKVAAADPEAFTELQNREAAEVFADKKDIEAETADLLDDRDAYQPTHANMRDAILRREKGWLGWLSNASQRWAAFDGASGRWSIGETDAAMRSAVRKEIAARRKLPLDAKAGHEMSRASWALSVHALLRHHSALEIPRQQFNADHDVLGVPGGALRFGPQMQIEAGRPDHMLSKTTRFAVGVRNGGGGRPEWDRFVLEFCSKDKLLVQWLQAFCGYCLTGHTMEHMMLFLYGPGGNGKSLFLDTIGAVMGDYHVRSDHRLFMAKMGNFHLAPLAALEGARLVTCPDVPQGAAWDMGLVKLVTGGGSVTANYMRENPFSFVPECKLILAGNDKPKLESVDEGVRRRLKLVPCMHMPEIVDRGLPDKLLREGEGILRWMLDGWEMWAQFGLPECRKVEDATDEYLNAADVFGRWLKEEITVDEAAKEKIWVGDLWRSWDAFKAREGAMRAYPNDMGSLSTRLKEQDIGKRKRDAKGSYITGIKLRQTAENVF